MSCKDCVRNIDGTIDYCRLHDNSIAPTRASKPASPPVIPSAYSAEVEEMIAIFAARWLKKKTPAVVAKQVANVRQMLAAESDEAARITRIRRLLSFAPE